MKITKVICQILRIESVKAKTAGTQDTIVIRVQTDAGVEGIGEADASPEVVKAIIDAPFSHNIACGLRDVPALDVFRATHGRHRCDGRH
jgi:L-rhamnonate dehydratase